ncbi:MAG: ABC transporter ATP-binding protein [Roseibacillus sp.]
MTESNHQPVLRIRDLVVEFKTEMGTIRALDKISFDVMAGESLGIVGESGCGKSVTALSILKLIPSPPGRIAEGSIELDGIEVVSQPEREMRKVRGALASMIFQEPMTALDPVYTIGNQMVEVIRVHQKVSKAVAKKQAIEMLRTVNIESPEKRIDQYPHELSGGMRQRVMIAMALSCSPKLLIADEPTTALDVTVQAQVMEEIKRLQQERNMGLILITHDLGVIAESCSRVVVMYCGKIIEMADTGELYQNPRHPYTRGLLDSIPRVRKEKLKTLPTIQGMVPDLADLPKGCRFADRCPKVEDRCRSEEPPLEDTESGGKVACFHPN